MTNKPTDNMISENGSRKKKQKICKQMEAERFQRELVLPLFIIITLAIMVIMLLSIPFHKSSLKEIKEFAKEAYEIRMDEYFGTNHSTLRSTLTDS